MPKPTDTEPEELEKPAAKGRRIRFNVGTDIDGVGRFEQGDTASADVLRPPTRRAWLDQGLIEEVR